MASHGFISIAPIRRVCHWLCQCRPQLGHWQSQWHTFVGILSLSTLAYAQQLPHRYTAPPNDPYDAQTAAARMTVPPGFKVEVVACEPDLVNPVAMTFDERGRIWVTESVEYPRMSAGPGRDRVKVLEDTDADGRVDKVTVFADDLNIPSGIAVGAGGVWVANSPDILFMQDTDGDGRADTREVVVTGFGRFDTHELPNSLTWGPDGWLYGWNGVFNASHVEYRGKTYDFTCAIFRIHPKTRDFELFCEGTSNPWGIAFNDEGDAFASACVIDHLWHLTETGYYHRQAGAYPPHTWKIESIVDHAHQKAAYCGIHWFDSEAYPPEYRERLYMGNIHGNAVNCDKLERRGSTYRGIEQPDFLQANDTWFMPVVQKTGPDGCLYILDWYDQFHCYQDAKRVPQELDRLKGRLYRIRYNDTPRAAKFDLKLETDEQLVERLSSPNIFYREIAQRLLAERAKPQAVKRLETMVLDETVPLKTRMHAMWAVIGSGPLDEHFVVQVLKRHFTKESPFAAWAIRAVGNQRSCSERLARLIANIGSIDPDRCVMLQTVIALGKLPGTTPVRELTSIAAACDDDPLIPHIVWNNLRNVLDERGGSRFVYAVRGAIESNGGELGPALTAIVPRALDRMLTSPNVAPRSIAQLVNAVANEADDSQVVVGRCLEVIAAKAQTGELPQERRDPLKVELASVLESLVAQTDEPLVVRHAALLATSLGMSSGFEQTRRVFNSNKEPEPLRLQALEALISAGDQRVIEEVRASVLDRRASNDFRRRVFDALGRCEFPLVGTYLVETYPKLADVLKPQVIELLSQRPSWSKNLLAAIADKKIPADAVNINQVRRLLASKDPAVVGQATKIWGAVRSDRNPAREQVIADMRKALRSTSGDPHAGRKMYDKLCAQCHKMYGQGQEVGPDITVNGRANFEQLLSNVFDPSLVIGNAYQARIIVTDDGRNLTGLVAEDSPERVVLKVQGGKLETIPRSAIDEMQTSKLSLMPEGIEKQYSTAELADLFAYLTLDKPPDDPAARPIPGSGAPEPRETTDPAEFNAILAEVAPRFTIDASGLKGVALIAEHFGREWVVRTHPIDRTVPCVLRSTVTVPERGKTRLVIDASHDPRGNWQLVVRADGQKLLSEPIDDKTAKNGWRTVNVDLTKFAGKTISLEVLNEASGWKYEFAYWGRVDIVTE